MAKSLRSKAKASFRAKKRSSVSDYSVAAEQRTQRLADKLAAGVSRKAEAKAEEDVDHMDADAAEPPPPPPAAAAVEDERPPSTSGPRRSQRELWQQKRGLDKRKRPAKTTFGKSLRSSRGKIRA